jgi:hypothetical protein
MCPISDTLLQGAYPILSYQVSGLTDVGTSSSHLDTEIALYFNAGYIYTTRA